MMLKEQTISLDYQSLYQATKRAIIWRIKNSKEITPRVLYDFSALILQDDHGLPILPAVHHMLWMELACNPDIRKLLIIGAPESAKTTWSLAFAACYIGFWPERSVIITSVSDDVAEQRSLMVRNLTETETWADIFPEAMRNPSLKYEQAEWSLGAKARLHPTMRSYGLGASIVGSRADLIIADDILDFDSTRTQHQRMLTDQWFHNSLLSRLKPNGRIVMIGTSWASNDLYNQLATGDNDWVVCRTGILSKSEDGFYATLTYPNNYKGRIIGEPL